jgi:hypothetical protein
MLLPISSMTRKSAGLSERWLATKPTGVHSVVVGMHDALPDSISTGHGMNESAQMERSGRRIYQDLLAFRAKTNKCVYVLASHSHFLIEDVYNDTCHPRPETLLPGWIIGTAGAIRYRLPRKCRRSKAGENGRLRISPWDSTTEWRNSFCVSRKCSLGIFLHRLESTMEASKCKHVSRRTSPRMFRRVPIVQQAFRAPIDDPKL